jgi:putative flippase GtrA
LIFIAQLSISVAWRPASEGVDQNAPDPCSIAFPTENRRPLFPENDPTEALGGIGRACYANGMMMPFRPSDHIRALIDAVLARLALIRKAGTFAIIGVVNTAVDFGVFATAYKVFGLPLVPANILSWMVAVSCSYVLNSSITFAAESGRKLTPRTYATFVASGVVGLIGNTTMLWFASYFVPVLVAKLMAIGVSFLLNFSLSHFVVFRPRATGDAGQRPDNGRQIV